MAGEPYTKAQQLGSQRKRYRRKVASQKQWQAIRAEKCYALCRICRLAAPQDGHDSHHLVPRDRFGDDVPENIIGLCRDCHRGVELHEPAHCRLMLTRLSDREYAYAVTKGGEGVFARVYGIAYER